MHRIHTKLRNVSLALPLAIGVLASVGCQPYQLTGVVMAGAKAKALAVSADDERLKMFGLDGATIEITVDPLSIQPRMIGVFPTDRDGRFEIPVDALGAGFLEYELAVCCQAEGYQTIYQTIKMPSRRERLLILMVAGRDTYEPRRDILEETQKLADELLKK